MTDIDRIKEKLDVSDIVGEYVQLKPAGINQKGLCPFHQEKTPSFMVSRERGRWHCFGCGKGGDIFTFIQEMEGMEFAEALKLLAQKAGVTLTNTVRDVNTSQKNRIKTINQDAARFFHQFLLSMPQAKEARAYLSERGVSEDAISNWQIGFVSDQWDLLTKYLLKKGHSIDDLVSSGLTVRKEGADARKMRGHYDRFRGRIMFPIQDVHGAVVGFTGRVLKETEESGGKYINTPQTLVYDKSRVIFGLNYAKQEIRAKDLIVMVEGQMDVIACHEAGMKNVVAVSGTALTEPQLTLLKRYSENLSLAFDMDAAGMTAARRSIRLALEQGLRVRVIHIPDGAGKDPDEVIKKNKDVWFAAVDGAQHVMAWILDRAFAKKNIADPSQKQEAADAVLEEIGRIPFAVERDHWLQALAERLRVDAAILRQDLSRFQNKETRGHVAEASGTEPRTAPEERSRFDHLAKRMAVLIMWGYGKDRLDLLLPALSTSRYGPLYETWKSAYTLRQENGAVLLSKIEGKLANDMLFYYENEFGDASPAALEKEAGRVSQELLSEWKKKKRRDLQHAIAAAEKTGDAQALAALMREFQDIGR